MGQDGVVTAWAHYLGGREGYPRRLNGVKVSIDDAGIHMDGPYRNRFFIDWAEVEEIGVEGTRPDMGSGVDTVYVTRLVKRGKGSSVPVSKPAAVYLRVETSASESVVFAVAGTTADHLRAGLSRWVEWPDHETAQSA